MDINWITGGDDWAFKNLCRHLINALPKHKHECGNDADIKFACSPTQLPKIKADPKTILHIDSNRWYKS